MWKIVQKFKISRRRTSISRIPTSHFLLQDTMKRVSDILEKFNPLEDKYISREFQSYGIYLAEELDDVKHKALYIKLARDVPRAVLEKTLSFVKIQDQGKVKSKPRLFMWKLKELGAFNKKILSTKHQIPNKSQ